MRMKTARYVSSRFNAQSHTEDGGMILYNSYTGAIASFGEQELLAVKDALKQGGVEMEMLAGNKLYQELVEHGFLVPEQTDELRRAAFLHQSMHRTDLMHLVLLVTEACNFRCHYCYEDFPSGRMTDETIQGLKAYIEQKANTLGELAISWHGGEPLLVPHIIEELSHSFMDSAERHGVNYSAEMSTNGYYITEELFPKLLNWKINRFMITLDGPEDVHNVRRGLNGGGGTYSTIVNNLMNMKKVDADFEVNIRMNFDNSNLEAVSAFIPTLRDLFADDHRFKMYFRPVGCMGGENDLHLPVCDERTKDEMIWAFNRDSIRQGLAISSAITDILMPTAAICYAAKPSSLVVGSNGQLYKCSVAIHEDFNQVGTLGSDGVAHLDYDKIAYWTTSGEEQDEKCQACFFRPACQGNHCPLYRMRTGNRPCSYEKRQIKRTLQAIWEYARAAEQA